jgi:hemerythrin-like domain-containing protein
MSPQDSPVAAMFHEHEVARKYTQALCTATERWIAGDQAARTDVVYNARHYTELLRNHIAMEEWILLPIADHLIPQEKHDSICQSFENIEGQEISNDAQGKYLALADALVMEVFGVDKKLDDRSTIILDLLRPALTFDNE